MAEPKEIFSTTPITCFGKAAIGGRKGGPAWRTVGPRQNPVVELLLDKEKPAHALVITFRGATTDVLCPYLADDKLGCTACTELKPSADGGDAKENQYPTCAYRIVPTEDNK